ncbi:DUF1902 domain-containing protein [Candidatus Kaiserbacteria bacterium CG10_big_fil_rev_8_21_14_0_10_44_10]|uniref:DUF1902 domain-containing protein n=1 Tax=Candidatus Kaiserbacteria bacterium CG10_big_fil_rev_8_21_14_0_10_44_10 TaxID=1974606 RepID=A0A2H0UHE2_9BACT|nr:MAG: DUF1902 domain-containing protein [Candidatus Kaiserbacteria bacterium CG10_big_fil_rev_8_21_14_0_10_44_10]
MKKIVDINLDIERLPEGYFVATSNDVQGLVAQGKTFEEVVLVAKDVAKVLLRAQGAKKSERGERIFYPTRVTV